MPEGVPYLRREVYKLRKRLSDAETMLQLIQNILEAQTSFKVYNSYTDVQAANVLVDLILVLSDYNGSSGIFVKNASYTVILQGADGITDVVGKIFKRSQNE